MDQFTKIINFIMQLIDRIKSFFGKKDDAAPEQPEAQQ